MTTTCWRLIGKAGEPCQTCGRIIVRRDIGTRGSYALEHEGPGIAAKLHALNEARKGGAGMTGTYSPQRGDIVTCDGMATPHEVHAECVHPVLVERPQPAAPFARTRQANKARGLRYCVARP